MKVRLFLTAWVLYSAHLATNVVREHYPAFSLAERGTFRVDEYQGLHSDIFVHRDGHSYIGNNVATSVVAAVPLFVFDPLLDALEAHSKHRLAAEGPGDATYRTDKPNRQRFFAEARRRGLELRLGAAAVITTVFLMAPLSALLIVYLFGLLRSRGVAAPASAALALLLGFGTPIFFRTAHLTNNMFVMYATFASFCLLWAPSSASLPAAPWRRWSAGLLAGFALACDYSGLVPLVCLYGYLVVRRLGTASWTRAVAESVPFVLGSVPPVLFLLYSQWAMYGNPFFPGQYWMPQVNYTERGWRGFSWPATDLFLLNLLHPSYGMYAFGPILLLGLIPAPRHRHVQLVLPRPERIFVVLFTLAFLLFCAANQYSRMQWNTGFRYLLPLVPLIFLACCDQLLRWPRAAAVAVATVAFLHSWVLCLARDCGPPGDSWRHADGLVAWLAGLGVEWVPASYARIWAEGLQFPWLRVLRQVAPVDHPLLSQPWLPWLVLGGVCLAVWAIWSVGRRRESHPLASKAAGRRAVGSLPTVDLVIPVLNEAHVLEASVNTLRLYLHQRFPYPARIVIADNGSTDGTGELARELAARFDDVSVVSLAQRGRGRALRVAWTQSQADIVAYTDVDLSTEIEALETLCRGIHEDGYELATGSRLMRGSHVTRCFKREVISRLYNLFIKCVLFTRFSDAQCGFKAASRRVIREIVPLVKDQAWFFDTELIVLCEKLGYPVLDVPVRWFEDPDTRVKIVSTAWQDIKGVCRLRALLWQGVSPASAAAEPPGSVPPGPTSTPALGPVIGVEHGEACR